MSPTPSDYGHPGNNQIFIARWWSNNEKRNQQIVLYRLFSVGSLHREMVGPTEKKM